MVREWPLPKLIERVNATNLAAGIHQPTEPLYRGRVYLLVNGGSASSGAEVPALLHHLRIGTQIGEEPNGLLSGRDGRHSSPARPAEHEVGARSCRWIAISQRGRSRRARRGAAAPPAFEVPQSLDECDCRQGHGARVHAPAHPNGRGALRRGQPFSHRCLTAPTTSLRPANSTGMLVRTRGVTRTMGEEDNEVHGGLTNAEMRDKR
jgi:hypothetical protein